MNTNQSKESRHRRFKTVMKLVGALVSPAESRRASPGQVAKILDNRCKSNESSNKNLFTMSNQV